MKSIEIKDNKAYISPIQNLDAIVEAPPSKAHTLRALFIASLADGETILKKPLIAEDQNHAIECLNKLGAEIKCKENLVIIKGVAGQFKANETSIYVGASGASARFLAVMSSLADKEIIIDGTERMRTERPLQDLIDAAGKLGITIDSLNGNGCVPISIKPGFNGGKTALKGNKSSQYFTSLLMSAPYAKNDVIIKAEGKLVSKPYIDITISMMKEFGVEVDNQDYNKFTVKAGQSYNAIEYAVEGDYSSASFFFAAAAITGGKIRVTNLKPDSAQGDKKFVELLEQMGCEALYGKDYIELQGKPLKAIKANMKDFPDIVSPIAVVAAFADGKSEFFDISHLKYKECDRLSAPVNELKKMGVIAECTEDSVIVQGGKPHAAEIDTYKDHRMVMSFAVAALAVPGLIINNPENIEKSFPDFFKKLEGFYK